MESFFIKMETVCTIMLCASYRCVYTHVGLSQMAEVLLPVANYLTLEKGINCNMLSENDSKKIVYLELGVTKRTGRQTTIGSAAYLEMCG